MKLERSFDGRSISLDTSKLQTLLDDYAYYRLCLHGVAKERFVNNALATAMELWLGFGPRACGCSLMGMRDWLHEVAEQNAEENVLGAELYRVSRDWK